MAIQAGVIGHATVAGCGHNLARGLCGVVQSYLAYSNFEPCVYVYYQTLSHKW